MFPCLQFIDGGPRKDVCIPNAANLYCGTQVHFLTVLFCQCVCFSLYMSRNYSNCCIGLYSVRFMWLLLFLYMEIFY